MRGVSLRRRWPVSSGVSSLRSRVWSGGSVNPSPPGFCSAVIPTVPTRLVKSLLNAGEFARTARASSYPVTSHARMPKGSFIRLTGSRSRSSPSAGTGFRPSRCSGTRAESGSTDSRASVLPWRLRPSRSRASVPMMRLRVPHMRRNSMQVGPLRGEGVPRSVALRRRKPGGCGGGTPSAAAVPSNPAPDGLLALLSACTGHFPLESGHHGGLCLDLDSLFFEPAAVEPFAHRLADLVRPHAPDVVCGPLVGGAYLAQVVAARLGARFCHAE